MWLTHTMPASSDLTTRNALKMSRVHTAAARPYGVALAIRIASASSLNGMTLITGPKISSCAILARVVHVVEDGRLDVPALVELLGRAAADRHLGLAPADLEVAGDPVALLRAHQRAHLGLAVHPGAEPDGLRLGRGGVHELLVDVLLHQHPAAGGADLALVDEGAEEGAVHRVLEVGVAEEDVGRLAAQLERDPLELVRGAPHDQLAHLGAAGEGDLPDLADGRPAARPRPGRRR